MKILSLVSIIPHIPAEEILPKLCTCSGPCPHPRLWEQLPRTLAGANRPLGDGNLHDNSTGFNRRDYWNFHVRLEGFDRIV